MQRMCGEGRDKKCQQDKVWKAIKREAKEQTEREPMLASFFHATIIKHDTLAAALSYILANKLATPSMPAMAVREVVEEAYAGDSSIVASAACDICATVERDPAIELYSTPLLYLKGFHALQGFRVANWLWYQGRRELAVYLQNQISVACQVDVHPAACIGRGIMFDHATGIVIGETAVVEDDVSILQDVTLGGTGKEGGDRHPKIRTGVMIGAGAKVLGNIEVGEGAKIAACSVVLIPVPPHTTAAGVPAKIVGTPSSETPSFDMDQKISGNEFIEGDGI
ncbi:serine O-acetyltransferase [Enterovibrio norvegicus FF-33]|uniref:Serine acetyltransferase n=1 Tax=Enterovibrio norvegicus FF-454 TaxID=1185651 RepID=A0A1E5CFY6_9GAMM|nr:serine O-acetyltransferase [Enterovibrio norvegicus]OEE64407.1 serine O-acetyltransferase [Enterovibrio norvegicus FF-454]OEE68798.1 serine O-acetyltransferase [Enterovibrio norvegicus FF-33]OEE87550.1 serine O-acetyltransferase [Enterovibrio norvegicus FF-162]